MIKGFETLRENRISAVFAVSKIALLCIALVVAISCSTTRSNTSVTSSSQSSELNDSTYSRQSVDLDTLNIQADTNELFIPNSWIADSTAPRYSDSSFTEMASTVTQKVGRSVVSVTRMPQGIKIVATCDSLFQIIANKTSEIYRLRSQLAKAAYERHLVSDTSKVITRMPIWAFLALALSISINVVFIVRKILPK